MGMNGEIMSPWAAGISLIEREKHIETELSN
jgi:hypothetical protein